MHHSTLQLNLDNHVRKHGFRVNSSANGKPSSTGSFFPPNNVENWILQSKWKIYFPSIYVQYGGIVYNFYGKQDSTVVYLHGMFSMNFVENWIYTRKVLVVTESEFIYF